MMVMPPRRLLSPTLLLLLALPFASSCDDGGSDAARADNALRAAASGDEVLISTDNGLRLRPADGDHITVDDRIDAHWSRHDDRWTLDLGCADHDGHGCPRMPYVTIPDGAKVTVTARNAGIDVVDVAAALDVTTVNGDVTVTHSGQDDAPLRLSTRNGSVRASSVEADGLRATTVNGDVVLQCAAAPTGVTARTVNGSVDVTVPRDAPAYHVTMGTDNGRTTTDVHAQGADRNRLMTLSTVNGDVTARRD
ncbi:hypothetical protein DI272_29960 [Streptomyces sp. Act143]|uniref:DUF4097 family beta strand repeat-containing protein n=1 Tax=Streptomyces sp. Act143 TaxID=2200760 RepID=UPI000D67C396|nr:DUF4097 family beta strand repeat-containing protein [Streptomyces sp. Act143]PWI20749.1 hypothetical protein DI272_29960 [Streptomyces sp. Act143]